MFYNAPIVPASAMIGAVSVERIAKISDLAGHPEASRTSASRYLATAILFTRVDIAGRTRSSGCNGSGNSDGNDGRNAT